MYDFVDQRVTSLDNGGRFLIWSMRSWVKAASQRQCPPSVVAPTFAKWGAIAALPPFHKFMVLLSRNGLLTFRFPALECPIISEDEAILLELMLALHVEQPLRIKETLELIVDEDSVSTLLVAATSMATVFADAGLMQ